MIQPKFPFVSRALGIDSNSIYTLYLQLSLLKVKSPWYRICPQNENFKISTFVFFFSNIFYFHFMDLVEIQLMYVSG